MWWKEDVELGPQMWGDLKDTAPFPLPLPEITRTVSFLGNGHSRRRRRALGLS